MLGFIARHSALEATAAEAKVAPEKNEQTMAEQAAAFAEVSRIFHIARSGTYIYMYEFFFLNRGWARNIQASQ